MSARPPSSAFVAVTGLMVAVTLLPYATAAAGGDRRRAAAVAGRRARSGRRPLGRGVHLVGVLVSVLGAYLAWSLICAEVLFAAAKSEDMPKLFAAPERQPGAGQRAVADQYRRLALRHLDLLVATTPSTSCST